MSEEQTGTWEAFKEAHDWIFDEDPKPPSPSWTARAMSDLGHAEFDWVRRRWAIAPTVIGYLPPGPMLAVVTGGRHRELTRLMRARIRSDEFDVVQFQVKQVNLPSSYFLAGRRDEVSRLAVDLGLSFIDDAASLLSRALPTIDASLGPGSLVAGGGQLPHRFDATSLGWKATTNAKDPGLYRFESFGGPAFEYVDEAGRHHSVDKYVGQYLELARLRKTVLRYSGTSQTLSVPADIRLPVLQARAATLCTGLVPEYSHGSLSYPGVPWHVAYAIATSLNQEEAIPKYRGITEGYP
jgi:hypothetical protein